ncbi:MAG: aminoglycoside phosphotransferase family protein, partial [Alphaproteobacteria bacterium]
VSIYTKAADVAEMLLETQTNLCVLHGDIHHENIKYSDKRGWLTIDPKGLYGDRIFDAASVLCNPSGMDKFVANESRLIRNANILAQILQIDVNRLLAFTFAYAGLSASWSLEDNENPSLALKIAAITESHCST